MAVIGNTSNPMVDVTFQDLTNYAAASSTDDIAGVVLDTSWGPCGTPTVFDSTGYQTYFNPKGLGRLNSSMATVQRYFSLSEAAPLWIPLSLQGSLSPTNTA